MARRAPAHDASLDLAEPPVAGGTDAVAAWAQGAGLALAQAGAGGAGDERARLVRGALDGLGRCRAAARDAEALLAALAQREGLAADGGGDGAGVAGADPAGATPPAGEVALCLWQWYEMARLAWMCACGPLEVARDAAGQSRGLGANIRARPTAQAEEIRRRLRLPRDAREAVRAHEEVSAKLAEEALDEDVVQEARGSLLTFCTYMKKYFKVAPHLELICGALERVERGECRRLILNMPPQHGKTEVVSRLFPGWFLGRNPSKAVLFATHTMTYAEKIGRNVRNNLNANEFKRVFPDVRLAGDSAAASAFEIVSGDGFRTKRGQMMAYGMGGSYTGSPSNLLIFDDLLTEQDAGSDVALETAYESIEALFSRLAPPQEGDGWVVVNTRYNLRDIVAYLLREYAGEDWEVISLPAIAERDEDFDLPDGSVWHRKEGEALFAARYGIERLIAIRDQRMQTNPASWFGQYQCRPVPSEGNIVKWEWFDTRRYHDSPHDLAKRATRVVVSVDTSKGASDKAARTAISVWGEIMSRAYLLHCWAKAVPYTEQRDMVKRVCAEWHPHLMIIEDKSTGEALIPDLRRDEGWVKTPILGDKVAGGAKEDRMRAATPQMAEGQVWLPRSGHPECPWLQDFTEEITLYPKGVHRDQGDTVSQFLNWRARNSLFAMNGAMTPSPEVARAIGGSWTTGGVGLRPPVPGRRRGW